VVKKLHGFALIVTNLLVINLPFQLVATVSNCFISIYLKKILLVLDYHPSLRQNIFFSITTNNNPIFVGNKMVQAGIGVRIFLHRVYINLLQLH